ncbi:hypothetical protein NW768_012045 [Fusarium equiseti]|uniref:Major facilitator superfamily (MFS) profile domain-containing protein n=1 Tax=Fusarium equiseti TaxID=61235 RepID=A0ABQ8QW57_FUSEQ|nr:hypothetical protein NW768_012045 [Fusarium equiseti]
MSLVPSSEVEEPMPPGTALLVSDSTSFVLVPTPTNDPNDPLNWSLFRKAVNFGLMCALTIAMFTAVIIQAIFWPQMTVELGFSFDQLNIGLACNVAGLAVGCIFVIPFTIKYGRRSTYIASTAVMAAISWWSARMQTLPELYITNLLYGLACATNETIAQLTIADLFFVHQRGSANGLYIISIVLGNTIVPTIAGVQAEGQGWRWSYYTLGIVLTLMTVILIFGFEETSYTPLALGQHRSLKESQADHEKSSKEKSIAPADVQISRFSDLEKAPQQDGAPPPPPNTYRQQMRLVSVAPSLSLIQGFLSPWRMALTVHVLFAAIQSANVTAFLVLISSVNPIVMSAPPYNFGTAGVGLMLVGPFIGNIIGSLYAGFLGDRLVVWLARRNKGIFEPEMRLYILPLPVLSLGAGLILYGVALDKQWHWVFTCIGSSIYAFGMGSVFDVSFTMVIDAYKEVRNFGSPFRNLPNPLPW